MIQQAATPNDALVNTTVMVWPLIQKNADQKAAKQKVRPTAKACRFEVAKQHALLGIRECTREILVIVHTSIATMMELPANSRWIFSVSNYRSGSATT